MRRLLIALVAAILVSPFFVMSTPPAHALDMSIYFEKVEYGYYDIEFDFQVHPRWTVYYFHESNCRAFLEGLTGKRCLWVFDRGPKDEENVRYDEIGFIFWF